MNIHFIGIEGVSMRVLARIMMASGHKVTGSDISTTGHDPANVKGADEVVYTCAVGKNNVELLEARRLKIPVYERAEYLGKLSSGFRHIIAIAGSHGKTTTTGMLGKIFAPLNATLHIGGTTDGESGHVGGKEFFITEACEYRRNFLHIKPEVSIVLNVELDHTDYYTDLDDYFQAFYVFACSSRMKIINADDPNSNKLMEGRFITFGLKDSCDYCAKNIRHNGQGWSFTVYEMRRKLGDICLKLEGRHNIYNALSAIAAARYYRMNFATIKSGLEGFSGAKRRFEHVGTFSGAEIYTDYAHHPSELKSAISSAHDAGFNKVTIIFEPHTYTRTKSLCGEFAQALKGADDVFLAPIFPAREQPIEGVSSHALCRCLIDCGANAACFSTFYEVIEIARKNAKTGSAIIFAGAGNIDKAAYLMLDENYFYVKN